MDNYIDDSDALSLLASEIRSLKEEIKRKNIIPPVQKEQKERDLSDMRVAVMSAIRDSPHPRASLTNDAEEVLRDFSKNYRSINRRPLFGEIRTKRLGYIAIVALVLSLIIYGYSHYQLYYTKDAYAKRAYYVSVELGMDEPQKAYDYVQKMWSKQKKLVKAKVKSLETESQEKPDDSK
jgi:hypothetical protein